MQMLQWSELAQTLDSCPSLVTLELSDVSFHRWTAGPRAVLPKLRHLIVRRSDFETVAYMDVPAVHSLRLGLELGAISAMVNSCTAVLRRAREVIVFVWHFASADMVLFVDALGKVETLDMARSPPASNPEPDHALPKLYLPSAISVAGATSLLGTCDSPRLAPGCSIIAMVSSAMELFNREKGAQTKPTTTRVADLSLKW
ncbi:hypothetical protein C8R44DRAFT_992517 [Mycena epipterygia]|nr:hypothetical protein C8R44DRAFT_992517 [Mycena epipterygia]